MRTYVVVFAAGLLCLLGVVVRSARAAEPEIPGLLFSESFDDSNLLQRGWYDGDRFKIVRRGAYAGTGCIEYGWEKKGGPQVVSSPVRHLFTPTDTVYLRFYIKLSPNWGWSGKPYHPHLTHFLTTANGKYHGPAASHLTLYVEPVNGKLRLAAQDIQNKDAPHGLTQGPLRGGYNGKFYDSAQVLFRDADWHCVEAMFKLNSVDPAKGTWEADGEVRGWFDGKLVIERTDVVFRTVDFPDMKFNQFMLAPYFGPGLVPHAQSLWIDELAVGTRRIGPLKREAAGAGPAAENPKPKALIVVAAGTPPPGTTSLHIDALSQPTSKPANTYVLVEALAAELKALGVEVQVASFARCPPLKSLLPLDIVVFAGPAHHGQFPPEIRNFLPQVGSLVQVGAPVLYSAVCSAGNRNSGEAAVTNFLARLARQGADTVPGIALVPSVAEEEIQQKTGALAKVLVEKLKE